MAVERNSQVSEVVGSDVTSVTEHVAVYIG